MKHGKWLSLFGTSAGLEVLRHGSHWPMLLLMWTKGRGNPSLSLLSSTPAAWEESRSVAPAVLTSLVFLCAMVSSSPHARVTATLAAWINRLELHTSCFLWHRARSLEQMPPLLCPHSLRSPERLPCTGPVGTPDLPFLDQTHDLVT